MIIDLSWPFVVMNNVVFSGGFYLRMDFFMLFYIWELNWRLTLRIRNFRSCSWLFSRLIGLNVRPDLIKTIFSLRVVRWRYSVDFGLMILISLFHFAIFNFILLTRLNSSRTYTYLVYFSICCYFNRGPHLLADLIWA